MDAVNSVNTSSGDILHQHLDVIINQPIKNTDAIAREILQHCMHNDFPSTKFSYDITGYPNIITANIYESKTDYLNANCIFKIRYYAHGDDKYTYELF